LVSETKLPEGIHTVEMIFADVFGVLRGKKVPANQWPRVEHEGSHIPGAPLYWGVRCECPDESPAGGMDEGYPDVVIKPIPGTLREVPWRPGVAQVFCAIENPDGTPSELCPRNALVSVLGEFEQEGVDAQIALEMEFYLLDPETHRPLISQKNTYGVYDGSPYDAILTDIMTNLVAYGLPVEAGMQEYGTGQMEITLRYDRALKAADDAILMRGAVKELAAKHGLVATYMAKPFDEESGSGLHIHQSMWRDGTNLFDSADGPLEYAMHYLGGLQRRIGEFSLFGSWSVNDYKRRQDFTLSPTTDSWGGDNRTVAIRMIEAEGSYRFEQRDPCSTSNLYLAVAGQLAAGLDGVRNRLQPGPRCELNAYTDPNAKKLPRTVPAAIDALNGSDLAREAFPALLIDTYVDTVQREYDAITQPVSELERTRYIGAL
jgi:glutamine synthetase